MEGDWREEKAEQRARQEEIVYICQAEGNLFLRGEKGRKNDREEGGARAFSEVKFGRRIRTLTRLAIGQRFPVRDPGCSLAW